MIDETGTLFEFVKQLLALRRAHPVFRRPRFFRGVTTEDLPFKDISWFTPDAREMTHDDWHDASRRCFAAVLSGDTADRFISLQGYREIDDSFLLILNAHDAPVAVTLPPSPTPGGWREIIDTGRFAGVPEPSRAAGERFDAVDRSLALFIAAP
jgi:glycogen operon protein